MNKVELKDAKGQLIGWIESINKDRKLIRNNKGILLGWYDLSTNKTTCAKSGRWVAMGDQLTTLL